MEKRDEDKTRPKRSVSEMFALPARWSLIIALILAPWAFASVHHWAQQWMALALLIGLGFWWFETAMNSRNRQTIPYIAILVLGGIAIGLIQLVALPDGLTGSFVGRQVEIYQNYSGEEDPAIRVSLNREGTWAQISYLIIALAGLLLGSRYFRTSKEIVLLLGICTANGMLLAFLGIVQRLTYNGKVFWIFEVLRGDPFGPFINKNNGAGFLLMCLACSVGLIPIVMAKRKTKGPALMVSKEMPFWRQLYFQIMYFVAELNATKVAVLLSVVLISSGVMGCVSRGGVVALLIGGIITIISYGLVRKPKNSGLILLPLVGMVLALSIWVGIGEKVLERFERVDLSGVLTLDSRIQHWADTWPAVEEMGVLGSGMGTYRNVHRLYSTGRETGLFEYAENQFFQAIVEAGWPGLILFVLAWVLAFHYAFTLLSKGQSATSIGIGTFGIFLLSSQATASLFDFGMYVPANFFMMSVLVGFLGHHAHALGRRLKKTTWLKFETPNLVIQIGLLALFAGLTLIGLDLFRKARLDRFMQTPTISLDYKNSDLAATDNRIKAMAPLVQQCPTVKSWNYMAELWIHRTRLGYLADEQSDQAYQDAVALLNEEEKAEFDDGIWAVTTLQWIQEHAFFLKQARSKFQARMFLNSNFIEENLMMARSYLQYSRNISPLQPVVHLRLGQIAGVSGEGAGRADMERAIELAPNNTDYREIVGVYYLQSGNAKAALPHFQKILQVAPRGFNKVMNLVMGNSGRQMEIIPNKDIAELILPDDPGMLFQFANERLKDDPEVQTFVLEKARRLIGDEIPLYAKEIILQANIRYALGDREGAIESLMAALKNNPNDDFSQYRVTRWIFETGDLTKAKKEADKLLDLNNKNPAYNRVVKEINSEIEQQRALERMRK